MMTSPSRIYFHGPIGQRLRIYEWGNKDLPAVVLIHGFPGCGEHARLMSGTPLWGSFRLIAMDRPGYGESDIQLGLTPRMFAEQVQGLLNAIGVDQFSLISISGGAPFALALASIMEGRILKIACVGGIAPIDRTSFFYMNNQQKKVWFLQKCVPRSILKVSLDSIWKKSIEKLDEVLFTKSDELAEADAKIFLDPQLGPELVNMTKKALQKGSGGVVTDLYIYGRDWGIDFSRIKAPVILWHGTKDNIVNKRFSKQMRKHIAHAELRFIPHESHYSMLLSQRDDILKDLVFAKSSMSTNFKESTAIPN